MPRGHDFRKTSQLHAAAAEAVIPNKLYFRIGEVSALAGTKPYVLRYWETEFPTLKPVKTPSGHRLYRRQDVEMVLEIKRLLYEEGFTIEGARKQLAGYSDAKSEEKSSQSPKLDGTQLKAIKLELQSLLTLLSRKC